MEMVGVRALFLLFLAPKFLAQNCGKTPPTIEQDFISNCMKRRLSNCSESWAAFKESFSGQDPAEVMPEDYQPYFDSIPIQAGPNQSLFWSKTFSIVEMVSTQPNPAGALVHSSTNEPSSAVINDLGYDTYWCGLEGGGIDYVNDCLCAVAENFWARFSFVFANAAQGTAFWLGDGEHSRGAFENTSYFKTIELPNLNAMEVVAIVVHRKGKGENCSDTANSTIGVLRSQVTGRSIAYDCYDVYGDINQTSTIAACVSRIIGDIQKGMRPDNHQVDCPTPSSGTVEMLNALILIALAVIAGIILCS